MTFYIGLLLHVLAVLELRTSHHDKGNSLGTIIIIIIVIIVIIIIITSSSSPIDKSWPFGAILFSRRHHIYQIPP